MKIQMYYITDTYCCWCFGFSKTINAMAKHYADKININVLNGGMVPKDLTLEKFFNRFPDPVGLHSYISDKSKQKFGEPYLDLIRNLETSNRILNSNVPAKAMIAFKQLGVDGLTAATKIQNAHYVDSIDLQKIESYKSISANLDVSFDKLKKIYSNSNTAKKLSKELDLVRKLRVQGFPAILVKNSDGNFKLIASGFVSYDHLKTELDKVLATNGNVKETEGLMCATNGSGCS